MKNKTILLTGATGYLGGFLSKKILECGYNIIALALNKNEKYKFENHPAVKLYYLSETQIETVFEENKIDIVIHTATLYGRSNEDIPTMIGANLEFPVKILSLAIKYNCELFINTDTILDRNTNPYSLSKRQFVDWLEMQSAKIKTANMRLDHFYGPNDKPIKFIAWLIEQFKNNAPKIDLTEGKQKRDFVYIDDVTDAYICILNSVERLSSEAINTFEVGSGNMITVKEMVLNLKNIMKNNSTVLNFGAIPLRKNELLDYNVDISKLKELGYNPKYNITEGLKKLIQTEGL